MNFRIQVRDLGTENVWWETYSEDIENPEQWAKDVIKRFNATLKPYESARELLKVELIDMAAGNKHDWTKTNLVTVVGKSRAYDELKCSKCGITAKRYGLNRLKLDSKYSRAKVYQKCDTTIAHLEKLALKKYK